MAEQTQAKDKTAPAIPKKPQGADPGEYFYNIRNLNIMLINLLF